MTLWHRRYGLLPDPPDSRDLLLVAPPRRWFLPSSVNLKDKMPPIYDQGSLGSCVGQSVAAVLDFAHRLSNESFFNPSRLFIYFNARDMEGTVDQDVGCCIRDAVKSVNKLGACPERLCPYVIKDFAIRPTAAAYKSGEDFQAIKYQRVPLALSFLKGVLAKGIPIVLGISIYSSFETEEVAKTGIVPMPNTKKEQSLGGHAVVVVGYDDKAGRFLMRNSWGTAWGDKGYFTIPYDFITNPKLTNDAWMIEQAE